MASCISRPADNPPPGPDDRVLIRHRDVEDECWAAYLDGFAAGLAEANRRMTEALTSAVAGPTSYGLTARQESARDIVHRLARTLEVRT